MSKNGFLNKSDFLSLAGARVVEVKLSTGEGSVYIRTMTSRERDQYETQFLDKDGNVDFSKVSDNLRARLVGATLCDEQGTLFFSPKDYDRIGELPAPIVEEIYEKAQIINGMVDDVDGIRKQLKKVPSSNSTAD